ncbi:hypothetical protein F5Y02DRAFT_415866 [Annulohypoxylon stygium]|nr:hypothetical protein F5Y02DRAFT_415866 [Annulohypoxylon stygium]
MEFLRSIIHPKDNTPVSYEVKDIITRKKQQYCRYADNHQWQNMFNIALPEAIFRFFKQDGEFFSSQGRDFNFASTDEFTKCLGEYNKASQTVHLIGPGEFEQAQPDEVKVIWSLIFHQAGMEGSDLAHHTGGGYYHETWRRKGNDWFLQDLKLETTFYRVIG